MSHKILHHLDRVREWKNTGICAPITLELNLTNSCNHNCPDCIGYRDDHAMFLYTDAVNVIQQFKDIGVKSVTFSGGGDPLCNAITPRVVKYCSDIGLGVGIVTNGGLLHRVDYVDLAKYATWLRISLDAGSEDVYKLRHGSCADFNQTISNLTNLSKVEGRRSVIGVSYLTDGKTTLEDIVLAAGIVKDSSADYLEFKSFRYSKANVADFIIEVRQRFADDKFSIYSQSNIYDKDKIEKSYDICHGQHFSAMVLANGDMVRCCEMEIKQHEKPFGNVYKDSVKNIWFGEERCKVLSQSLSHCPPLCRHHISNEILDQLYYKKNVHCDFI